MKSMKYIVVLLVAVAAFGTACNNSATKENKTETAGSEMVKAANSDSKTIHLTNVTFKEKVFNYEVNQEWKYEGDKPCIIDFYADWCGPCKAVAPVLEELAKEYDGQVIIYKVDTEKQRELASAFGIRSIPSLLFVPASGQPQMAQGALPKEQFVKVINEFLLKKES